MFPVLEIAVNFLWMVWSGRGWMERENRGMCAATK